MGFPGKTGGHPRAAGGGWPRREQLCTSRPREDAGQLSDLCGWAQDCFKAGRMETGGVDRERGYSCRRKGIRRSESFPRRGTEPLFSFLLFELPKNIKGLLQSLLFMKCEVGRMKTVEREGSSQGEIVWLGSSVSQEAALVVEADG